MSFRLRSERRRAPSMQSEIAILNAEQYVGGPSRRHGDSPSASYGAAASTTTGMYGGLVESQPRTEPVANVKARRLRGRPRLDTRDETAADRRRTQIRLAQRAYRHRKDIAITSLEERVKGMEQVQKSMNREFSKFYDILLTEGILDSAPPHAAPKLRSIADKLFNLANTTAPEEEIPSLGGDDSASMSMDQENNIGDCGDIGMSTNPSSHDSQTSCAAGPEMNAATAFPSSLADAAQQLDPFDFQAIPPATPDDVAFSLLRPANHIEPTQLQFQDVSLGPPLMTPSAHSRLSSPASYASQERSFSRRLHRTSIERALTLAITPNPPPARFASVFGFTLLFESKETIVNRILTSLKRTQNEDLKPWSLPPKLLNANFASLSPFGQHGDFSPMSSRSSGATPADKAKQGAETILRDLQSQFLSPSDVEQFLNTIGIVIPAQADFVEAEIDFDHLRGDTNLALSAMSFTQYLPYSQRWISTNIGASSFGFGLSNPWSGGLDDSLPDGMDLVHLLDGHGDSGSGISSGIAPLVAQSGHGVAWLPMCNHNRTKITIDIGKLIEETALRSICLGQGPGVRQGDVVKALKIAAGLMPGDP